MDVPLAATAPCRRRGRGSRRRIGRAGGGRGWRRWRQTATVLCLPARRAARSGEAAGGCSSVPAAGRGWRCSSSGARCRSRRYARRDRERRLGDRTGNGSADESGNRAGPRRRIVLATAIAETSLTIAGVTHGDRRRARARRARFDPGSGMTRLVTERVTRAEADAARGAGRPGRSEASRHRQLDARARTARWRPFPDRPRSPGGGSGRAGARTARSGARAVAGDLRFPTPPPEGALTVEAQALLARARSGGRRRMRSRRTDARLAVLPLHPRLGAHAADGAGAGLRRSGGAAVRARHHARCGRGSGVAARGGARRGPCRPCRPRRTPCAACDRRRRACGGATEGGTADSRARAGGWPSPIPTVIGRAATGRGAALAAVGRQGGARWTRPIALAGARLIVA